MIDTLRCGYLARLDDVSRKERAVVSVINTDDIDSYKEVILPKGLDLKRYRKNPVVLWNHNQDPAVPKVPIARNQWIKPGSGGRSLVARTVFPDTESGHQWFGLYEAEILRAWSIGAAEDREKNGRPTERELRERPEWAAANRIIRSAVLVEYSAVPIGANPAALTTAIERGLWLPESVRELAPPPAEPEADPQSAGPKLPPFELPGFELPPFVGRSFAEVHRAAVARLRAEARRLAVDEADRIRGRV